jgi:hypothetical protein
MHKIDKEMINKLPNNYWTILKGYGNVGTHSINVLICTIRDTIYKKEIAEQHQNILKWAALLHDICKRGHPAVKGRDHIHPFISGGATLLIFRHFEFFKLQNEE